ncbi:hypothetical protein K491DRAFT_692690 [Lophiostoma macrostomum CBS 122681]|uniref:Ankyrin n=1 Tax=Lophiostoma macrostomum CBS 122681 TaxID=1314788 RepID=A0A6A6T6G4_9PLEO|nr:hypothetical protein K491DRAFT_692690 [Lophiostoma macrostomum CBS 122681]
MPVGSILRGFEGPTWNLAKLACELDDTSLVEQAFSDCTEEEDPKGLLRYSCRHAIQNNAEEVLEYLIAKQSLDVRTLRPSVVGGKGRSTAILDILLAHGWDINWRATSTSESVYDAEPFLWHIVHDSDLVAWCLDHGATVFPVHLEPLRKHEITPSQYRCHQVLERAAARSSVATFELLRSKGAPLGWRTLHFAVRNAALAFHAHQTRGESTKWTERMDMVRHLIDVVGVDVNALDHPVGKQKFDDLGTPICYVANLGGLDDLNTRELTRMLLDRGADPTPGLEEAKQTEYATFAEDVANWKLEHPGGCKAPERFWKTVVQGFWSRIGSMV